jgi:hypothetical protein
MDINKKVNSTKPRKIKDAQKQTNGSADSKQENNDSIALLNKIYLTCKTSTNSIEDVITSTKNKDFQTLISTQHAKYEVIIKECEMLAKAQDAELEQVDCLTKFKHWAIIKVGTILDCSTAYLAKMLYTGISCQIVELIQQTCEFKNADKDILNLAEKLSNLQEQNLHEVKKHLCDEE